MKLGPLVAALTEMVTGWKRSDQCSASSSGSGVHSGPVSGATSRKSLNTPDVHFLFFKIKKIDYQDEVLGLRLWSVSGMYTCTYSPSSNDLAFANYLLDFIEYKIPQIMSISCVFYKIIDCF